MVVCDTPGASCAEDLNCELSGVEGYVIEAQGGFFIVWSRDYCDFRSGRSLIIGHVSSRK